MDVQIICEDFSLTDSISHQVNERIGQIESHTRGEGNYTVFISKSSSKAYEVKIRTHQMHNDFVAHADGPSFEQALIQAKKNMLRQLDDAHNKRVTDRRH